MKARVICLQLCLFTGTAVALINQPAGCQDQVDAQPNVSLHDLMVQRRDTLHQLADSVEKQYESGQVTFDEVVDARRGCLQADLELAESNADRVKLHEAQVKLMRKFADVLKARHAAGRATLAKMLGAKAAALEAEIELRRAMAKSNAD